MGAIGVGRLDAVALRRTTATVGLLGPFRVTVGGRPIDLTTGKLRILLAALALSAGRAVSPQRLTSAVWDGDLPGNTRRTVQLYVTRLRRTLGGELVTTHKDGYALCVQPEDVDAVHFERLLTAAAAESDPRAERVLLADALGLWRGPAFDGLQSRWLEECAAPRLVELYLTAVERSVDLDVAEGRYGESVVLLRELVVHHPLRESLWVRLLVALHRLGRRAEALERYEAVRLRLADELGTDPGPELLQVYADLLSGRQSVGGTAGILPRRPVPRQLPPDVETFTGRDGELDWLCTGLWTDDDEQSLSATSVIHGAVGVGKSALAVHAAHRLADHFPDGQLYVDLHGATTGLRALRPLEVLGRFLRALGIEAGAVPADLDEASALFRSQTAGGRLLVVLDNAVGSAQIAPLLPGSPGCAVLVTARKAMSASVGARHLHLDTMPAEDASSLLGRLAGEQRVAAAPEAAAEVARLCGYLPLALRIAGARLAARPAWPMSALAKRLRAVHRRLDELEIAEVSVRASLAVSYQQLRASPDPLDRSAADAFGLLGLPDGPELGVPAAARLLDVLDEAAERILERLVDAHLLESQSPGRYRLHDLLRLYGRERVSQQDSEDVLAAALTRTIGFYTATAWHTLALLRPDDYRLRWRDDRLDGCGLEFADERANRCRVRTICAPIVGGEVP